MTHFLIALALVLATSVPAFARAMPMTQAVATAPVCIGHDCSGHHSPGQAHHRPMGARCIAPTCTSAVALPISGASAVALIDTVLTTYHPLAASSHLGLRPIPDAPPPRSLALS
ncbi:hypothetical protein AiwAL_16120 [Acidiphilium sp. AL]|jgi:hypothetical protein|uniref:Secreted protein n=1 Tax=Acidiphilium iwatense TaxID=768198 RepID=A0ABS9DZ43_9PROT|nr:MULTISPECIES: hypothetical protein [Acidiphilium]MCF3948021.1 hypothetical protein [Acidiphilium iwatense]MCU4161609.1 hypothetical protein [Acidiphilium sp. AL]